MSERKGFTDFWRAEGEAGHGVLLAIGHLCRCLYAELKQLYKTRKSC